MIPRYLLLRIGLFAQGVKITQLLRVTDYFIQRNPHDYSGPIIAIHLTKAHFQHSLGKQDAHARPPESKFGFTAQASATHRTCGAFAAT
jgi:hypothetical protein